MGPNYSQTHTYYGLTTVPIQLESIIAVTVSAINDYPSQTRFIFTYASFTFTTAVRDSNIPLPPYIEITYFKPDWI